MHASTAGDVVRCDRGIATGLHAHLMGERGRGVLHWLRRHLGSKNACHPVTRGEHTCEARPEPHAHRTPWKSRRGWSDGMARGGVSGA